MWMFAPSHLPANRHEDSGEMRCDTRAHTRQVVAVVALMILRAYGSPGETRLLVPDVDCKYPTVVYTARVGVWLSLHALSCYFVCMCYSQNFSWFVTLQRNSVVDYYPLFGALWTVCMKQWEKIVSDYLEAAHNWLWYLSFVCGGSGVYKLCWPTDLTITPHLAWWWDINKRSLDQLQIPHLKNNLKHNIWAVGENKLLRDEGSLCLCMHPPLPKKIKDHLCLLVCKIMWGDIDDKTNLFSIRKNILCWDSSVFFRNRPWLLFCPCLQSKLQ